MKYLHILSSFYVSRMRNKLIIRTLHNLCGVYLSLDDYLTRPEEWYKICDRKHV